MRHPSQPVVPVDESVIPFLSGQGLLFIPVTTPPPIVAFPLIPFAGATDFPARSISSFSRDASAVKPRLKSRFHFSCGLLLLPALDHDEFSPGTPPSIPLAPAEPVVPRLLTCSDLVGLTTRQASQCNGTQGEVYSERSLWTSSFVMASSFPPPLYLTTSSRLC